MTYRIRAAARREAYPMFDDQIIAGGGIGVSSTIAGVGLSGLSVSERPMPGWPSRCSGIEGRGEGPATVHTRPSATCELNRWFGSDYQDLSDGIAETSLVRFYNQPDGIGSGTRIII